MIQVVVTYHGKAEQVLAGQARHIHSALRKLGEYLHGRLHWVAQTMETLARDGWIIRAYQNAFYAQHPEVSTNGAARARLLNIGIDLNAVNITTTWQDFASGVDPDNGGS